MPWMIPQAKAIEGGGTQGPWELKQAWSHGEGVWPPTLC
jgi:hypothetical protein